MAVPSRKQKIPELARRFIVPPFSVLDARQGYWMERKRAWLSLGFSSGKGRCAKLLFNSSAQGTNIYGFRNKLRAQLGRQPNWEETLAAARNAGFTLQGQTSIFDPVLCEAVYRWFCPLGGVILDPFAGGSVRGIVACRLGRHYVGIDLRKRQVRENVRQAGLVRLPFQPSWVCGDALKVETLAPGAYDLVFSCPPYADLEVYSRDRRDLSTMPYPAFLEAYGRIIAASMALLRRDRFACFVVGNIRDKAGRYRNLVADTVAAFEAAGAAFYNDAVLLTPLGSVPVRAGKQFLALRKLGKCHQNVLVFVKGDARAAVAACGQIVPAGDTPP
ncbi:MAG TPA: DNA methyltransferase [Planctomycetota bacterium]